MLLAAATAVYAQTTPTNWDTSGNSLLNGSFYFRQVAYSIGDDSGDLGDADAIYGQITFNGNGTYTITAAGANGGALILDAYNGSESALPATTGTYAISSSGYGYITSPAVSGDLIFGLVSANGVFVGSSTDNVNGYNDMMIMAKIASPVMTASNFSGNWTMSSFDPNINGSFEVSYMLNTVATMSPDGNGHLNVASIKGYENGNSSPITQSVSGLGYIFSNGAAVATFPTNGSLLYGQKYFYFSPDGNFFFGGGPQNFDMIVGVKTNTSSAPPPGLYFQVGLDESLNEYGGDMDTYFGSLDGVSGSSGLTLIGHQRVNDFGGTANLAYGASLYDYTYSNPLTFTANEATTSSAGFIAGDGGNVIISTGLGGTLGISVTLQAPTPTASGVWIDPQGVVNSASFAPFTARIAPGELITLFGSNLSNTTTALQGGNAAPTTMGGVQVTIGGYPAPVFSVSPTQVSTIVPYEVTVGSTVGIQVSNAGQLSNTVTQYVSNTAPGVFTQCACGIEYGWLVHLGIGNSVSAVGSPVSDSNPAVEGETLAVGLTGLGAVTPSISDGAVAPTNGTNTTNNTITVDISQVASATVGFAGLLPGLAAEYQLNVTMPTSGITVGPNYFDVEGMDSSGYIDSYMSYPLIPVQATPPSTASVTEQPMVAEQARIAAPSKYHRVKPAAASSNARIPVNRVFAQAAKTGATANQ
jgi:uncharacterized protein (TIGR03437 family)